MVKSQSPWFPTRDEILTFSKDNADKSSKRDISKAFGIKGQDRIALKKILKDLANDGLIGGSRKGFNAAGELPNVFVMDIVCLLYTSPSPRDLSTSRMPSSA